jgi:hypothetical protein
MWLKAFVPVPHGEMPWSSGRKKKSQIKGGQEENRWVEKIKDMNRGREMKLQQQQKMDDT